MRIGRLIQRCEDLLPHLERMPERGVSARNMGHTLRYLKAIVAVYQELIEISQDSAARQKLKDLVWRMNLRVEHLQRQNTGQPEQITNVAEYLAWCTNAVETLKGLIVVLQPLKGGRLRISQPVADGLIWEEPNVHHIRI